MRYSQETKERAKYLRDEGFGYSEIGRLLEENPPPTTVRRWLDVDAKAKEREYKRTHREKIRLQERERRANGFKGATRRSKPKRVHYCECTYKIATRTLRDDDPKLCINCSHEIAPENAQASHR